MGGIVKGVSNNLLLGILFRRGPPNRLKIGTFFQKTNTFHHANVQHDNISAHLSLTSPPSDTLAPQNDPYYTPNSVSLSKIRNAILLRPTCVRILLRKNMRIRRKRFGNLSILDLFVLFFRVALLRNFHERTIDDGPLFALKPFASRTSLKRSNTTRSSPRSLSCSP